MITLIESQENETVGVDTLSKIGKKLELTKLNCFKNVGHHLGSEN